MESEIQYDFENEEQFWQELDNTVSKPCDGHHLIDDALRSYLNLSTGFPDYVQTEHDIRRCAYNLYSSNLFKEHADYIRRQFMHCLLQDDEASILHITTTFLLFDAREHEQTFELLNEESIFPRLVDLISAPQKDDEEGLHRQLMELLYEMARIQRITNDDLTCVDDNFICCLFDIIENVSGNVDDPYHYPVIRVLLVLNEQFMVAAHDPTVANNKTITLTNKVMKVLSSQGSKYKTFGENIILLLNREDETSLQLLTLKLFYLLFTTPPTYEYFYTNDLHVLVDILIRNLLDLPEEASALRHTYLRVLYPLLEHTQLKDPPHYKREEVRKLLSVLAGGQMIHSEIHNTGVNHFEDVDDTTKRLVHRCQTVSWLRETNKEETSPDSPIEGPDSPTKSTPPALPAPRKLRKRNGSKTSKHAPGPYLLPHMESARQSSLSMAEMAIQKEKPGVITPSRNPSVKHGLRAVVLKGKERPPLPQARRSGWSKIREHKSASTRNLSQTSEMDEAGQSGDSDDPKSPFTSPQRENASKAAKKPPPAPKTRRWRGIRSKAEEEVVSRSQDPGKFNPVLPSISLSSTDVPSEPQSPFSPPEEKTLSPLDVDGASNITSKKSKRISSVSAALSQAQAQALSDLGKTLEKATINEEPENEGSRGIDTIIGPESPTIHTRAILAPPSQAPTRGVPGPKMELERSPFLSDGEEAESRRVSLEVQDHDTRDGDEDRNRDGNEDGDESSEDEWN